MNVFSRILCPAIVVAGAVLLAGCGGRVDLISAIPEKEANEVAAVLLNAGIHAEKVVGKEGAAGVRVDRRRLAEAVDILRRAGLPRERYAGMGEVFKKEGMISSPVEERARYIHALSQEVADTLSRIDGVVVARVHIVLPERGTRGEPVTASSAAVFLKHQADADLGVVQAQIRRLVVNSIPGLTNEAVSISLVPAVDRINRGPVAQTTVLGIDVAAGSAEALATVLVTLIVISAAGLCAAGFLAWRYVPRPWWRWGRR